MGLVSRFRFSAALATAVMAGGAVMSYAPAANATVYNYEFDSFAGGNLTVIGTITVVPNGSNLQVTDITGTITGTDLAGSQAINGIVSNPSFPNAIDTPHINGSWFTYNDVAYNTDPHLDGNGVVFTTAENVGGYWNIWGNGPNNYTVEELTNDGSFAVSEDGTLTATEVGATPLPATLPLFASGLGALGMLGWRKKRKAQAAA